tara:strand:- start:515 stop:1462 length:948 start_codon:yes stop_codon:yes gene_type:complete
MEPEIYVFNSAGCHGHYLRYLIDRCSSNTPRITELPFNSLGNSHKPIAYSDYVTFVHSTQHLENKNLKNKKIIKIIYSENILYYERVAMNRAADANRDINTVYKDISFLKNYNNQFYEKIRSLYSVDIDSVPKWLLRDAYKLGFLDWSNQGSVVTAKQDIEWIEENLARDNTIHYTQVDVFFTAEKLKRELQDLDRAFGLDLEFDDFESVHKEFLSRNKILESHENTEIVLDAIKNNKDIPIPVLDIIQQAYVYAELEKKYDFITMPMINDFFKTTKEITDYLKLYPQHYKAMNPNLPKFNSIDNPFFLHRQNRK